MTGADTLVRVDVAGQRVATNPVHPLAAGEHVWGLASMGEGDLWTLIGRSVLAQVSADGEVVRRLELAEPHIGVFAGLRQLLYQVMSFDPPADAMTAGRPGAERKVWSRMRTRALPFARPAVAALNLVSCGSTANGTIPCWFPDQPSITLTAPSGASRELALEGLPVVAPEILLAAENPQRPIRDAFVTLDDRVWILGSGTYPADDRSTRPGGWLLARYDGQGRLEARMALPEPARILLGAGGDRCVLLAWDGRVVEVQP